ncbi:activity-dependent neuroprotector homeobox a [Alosa sapidissima]|uniref:activity-dependent neuroprotector homeobox a n=1 Tax=Alosa sapidissima TaxID=34773 RepID=UPI001C0A2997|nr:activity-dependent neuroprotector homeobox a [Alosa sapidissima]
MFQLPVNNLTRIRKARKSVKKVLVDIGLEYCKDHVEDFKEFGPDDHYVKSLGWEDVCLWYPQKPQDYRSKQFCCSECPFSSKYFSGYKNHFRNVHRQDYEKHILLNCPYCMYSGNKRSLETHVRLFHAANNAYRQNMTSNQANMMAMKDGSLQAVYFCKTCTYQDPLYNVVRRHIYREHFQHVAKAYVDMDSENKSGGNGSGAGINGIQCKICQFAPRSYEALVQHVVEFHEKIGYQVTALIGHTNIPVSRPTYQAGLSRGAVLTSGGWRPQTPQQMNRMAPPKMQGIPVLDHLKQNTIGYKLPMGQPIRMGPADSAKLLGACDPIPVKKPHNVSTAQTQKWKICTVCSQLFPESAYSAHFEKEHQAEKVRVMAKYIMKIHNFTSKCLYCNRYLPTDTLLSHLLVHGLSCPLCYTTFNEVEKIVAHKRQCCPEDTKTAPGESPLTFDLTVALGKPKNIQLIVTTYNMKDASEQSSTKAQAHMSDLPKKVHVKIPDSQHESPAPKVPPASLTPKTEVGKTLCPLCFSILKGPISEALSLHLRERHQVIQTMHPVEKKMTYKCIHCLGVYTSTMTASTITLHLVHCRGVAQSQGGTARPSTARAGQVTKPVATLRPPGIGTLKRELPPPDSLDAKKRKMVDHTRCYPTIFVEKPEEPVVLALDPKGHAEKTYEARKAFLTAYFNCHPYPSQREVEKLAASLWLWKSDVSSHFANRRRSCERDFVTRKAVVLLGFNMRAVNQVKHDLDFDPQWYFEGTDDDDSRLSKITKSRLKDAGGFHHSENAKAVQHFVIRQPVIAGQGSLNKPSNSAFTPKPGSYQEPISIDSDSDSDVEETTSYAKPYERPHTVLARGTGAHLGQQPVFLSQERRPRPQENSSRSLTGLIDGPSMGHSARDAAKNLDSSLSVSSPEEESWARGSVTLDDSSYRPAGIFEGQGKEVGLVGR